ncbi:adenosylmethionine decarboxylase [Virgifigura deserti]|uniref:adenosylmethionine decarboxylase n=1 Tax=Virgifigura deserti TaxID=2268457 RepID=UPI003CCB8890
MGSETDHYVTKDGLTYAGTHLLIDIWGAERLDDLQHVEATLTEAVRATGATLLNIDLHHFTPNNGVSGVAVLAESHMSIHTWPELGYAALDIFVCGGCNPDRAVPVLREAFKPTSIQLAEHKRGLVP